MHLKKQFYAPTIKNLMLFSFYHFHFYIDLLTRSKLTKTLNNEQRSSYYLEMLSKMPRNCCLVEMFYFVFLILSKILVKFRAAC